MTQLPHDYTQTCDDLLRRGREYLAQGELALASVKGWDAAGYAAKAYAGLIGQGGSDADFKDVVLQLSKDYRSHDSSVEWAVSAMALADNVQFDWLDKDGIGRRLDDVQRLVMLVFDVANPPQDPEAILRHAWICLANGALAVASEKGWEAALWVTKTYADTIGYEYCGDSHFDDIMRMLAKDDVWRKESAGCEYSALNLQRNASYCTLHPRRLYAEIVAEDIKAVVKLLAFIQERITAGKRLGAGNV